MAEEFGSNYITLSDDEGNDLVLEHLDTIEMNDTFYYACLPTDVDESDPGYGLVFLKQEEDEEGELYLAVPTEEENEAAYEEYMRRLYSDWDENDDVDDE